MDLNLYNIGQVLICRDNKVYIGDLYSSEHSQSWFGVWKLGFVKCLM